MLHFSKIIKAFILIYLVLINFKAFADIANDPLPEPLTLEYALQLADSPHPDILIAENYLSFAKDSTKLAESEIGFNVGIDARARIIEPPDVLADYGREDHQAKLFVSKSIYDFGRTSYNVSSKIQNEEIAKLGLEQVKQQRRIDIMQAFFDVLRADLLFARDNEAMAIAFIQFDRAKERQSLGQLSEIDVLEKRNQYLSVREDRYKSEARQRVTRMKMSVLLNKPNQVVSKYLPPKLEYQKYKIVDLDVLKNSALENNSTLRMLRKELQQHQSELKSIRANKLPTITAEAETAVYSRDIGSNDAWRIGVTMSAPLYQGGKVTQLVALKQREIERVNLLIYKKEQEIKQEVLDLWLSLDALAAQLAASKSGSDYRELYLDKARSIYEMEVKTDLGDAMVKLTEAQMFQAETEFEIALVWEKLHQLTQMTLKEMRQ